MRLRRDAKRDLIRQVPLFSLCSAKELAEVAAIADELDLPEGGELIREGDVGREFFVIVEGEVVVTKKGRKLATLGRGDFLGEIALVSGAPRTASAKTTAPTRALVIRDRDFRTLLRRAPHIQLKVLQALADRLAATSL
jgi:CRP/FNR family cyclic AMP-dependent transcriptional regulator